MAAQPLWIATWHETGIMTKLPAKVAIVSQNAGDTPAALLAKIRPNGACVRGEGMFDTGIERSEIPLHVIDRLRLQPEQRQDKEEQLPDAKVLRDADYRPTYAVSIFLFSEYGPRRFDVSAAPSKRAGVTALIGMDIISKGDLTITNLDGTTEYSFRTTLENQADKP